MIILKQDITKMGVSCIVNAANETLLGGGGVDGAIHRAAGRQLERECRQLNGCAPGQAKITKGYDLPCDYIIHTVGPIYGITPKGDEVLASCYKQVLNLAKDKKITNIAFPSISTGIYGYPKEKAIKIAIESIDKWKKENNYDIDIYICCVDEETFSLYNKEVKLKGD